jgi:RNA polymerase sigma factor (sigma-70 family)
MDNLQIISAIQSGNDTKRALTLLYENNNGLIGYCVKPYIFRPDYEDIRQEAFIALAQAAKDFDPTGPATFAGYAVKRIKWHLYRYFTHQTAAYIPQNINDDIQRYRQLKDTGITNDADICYRLNISREKLEEIRKAEQAQTSKSLFAPIGTDSDMTLADTITDDRDEITRIEEDTDRDRIRQTINAALDKIAGRPAKITRLVYFRNMSMSDICKRYNIPYSTATTYKAKALRELRKVKELRDFYDSYYDSKVYHDSLRHFNYTFSSIVEETAIKSILQGHDRGNK